ncbi:hypothetical protein B0H13DRAFT_1944105, partial [Mycena leptocephala]
MFSAEVDQTRNALRRIPLQLALRSLPHQPVLGGSLSLSQGFRLSLSPGFTSVQRNPFGSPTPPPLPKKRLCSVEVSASRSKGPSFSSTSCWSSSSLSTTVLRNLVARGSQCRYDGVRSTGGSPDGLEGVVNGSFTGWIIVPEIERWARGAFRGRGGGPGGYSVMASSNICFVRSPTGSCFLSMLMTMDVASGEAALQAAL